MASNNIAISDPASLPSLSSDGARLAAIGRLLRILNGSTPYTDTSIKGIQPAIELEAVETPAKMRLTNVWPRVVADTVSTTAVALSHAEATFTPLSGNTSDTEKLPKGSDSEDSDDEFWLKEYAKKHRKRPGSSAARQLEKRLLLLRQFNARRKSSPGATEESTEEILLSLYRALVTEEGIGEALSRPVLRSQERAGLSEVVREKLLPRETHSAPHPPTDIDAVSAEFTKELDREVEKQFQPGQKGTLPGPAPAKTRRNKKKTRTGKPTAKKPSAPRRGKKTVGMETKSKMMVTKVGKKAVGVEAKTKMMVTKVEKLPYKTNSGRVVKKTLKMEQVARCLLASF